MPAGRSPPAAIRLLPLVFRVEARRAAVWIAAATAAVAVVACGEGFGSVLAAVACGGLAALAAVGDLPRVDACPGVPAACLLARMAWPLAGTIVGLWGAGLVSAGALRAACAVTLGIAIAAVARMVAAGVARATAAAHAADPLGGITPPQGDGFRPVFGQVWIDRLALASTLVAMAVCYFLVPDAAAWFALIVGGLFVLLALPAATCGAGAADQVVRAVFARTVPGRPRLPGTLSASLWTIAVSASLLGWPALVAALLRSDLAIQPEGPVSALALLVMLATATAGTAWLAAVWGQSDDAARAVAFAAVAALLLVAQAGCFPVRPACAVDEPARVTACRNRC